MNQVFYVDSAKGQGGGEMVKSTFNGQLQFLHSGSFASMSLLACAQLFTNTPFGVLLLFEHSQDLCVETIASGSQESRNFKQNTQPLALVLC